MFKVPEGQALQQQLTDAEKNYVIQKNDYLKLEVYTNEGERIIDPDLRLLKDVPVQTNTRPALNYLIDAAGIARFPMIGEIKLEGLTIRQAEEILQKEYARFYEQPFVVLTYQNKRVIVLGAPGGQVIPLTHETMRLVEVLALAKGVSNDAKANNIRIMRGDQVFVADLSTFEGYKKNNLIMAPGDVVYVEPIRRPLVESLRDYAPVLSVVTSLTTLIIVIVNL
jgi:polysaccharide export outer membrane protein